MIPIGDDNRGRRTAPIINVALILANAAVFFYQVSLPMADLERFVFAYGAIPAELTAGIDTNPETALPLYATAITSMFIHGGWAHFLFNMLFLWVFGDNIEDSMGHVRYLMFYLLGGIAAVVGQVAIDPSSLIPMVGASGAISAVLAAYIVLFPGGLIRVLVLFGFIPLIFMVPAILMIGLWIVTQFLQGFASLGVQTEQTGGVAYFAHIGGFIAGFIFVWFFRNPAAVERQRAARRGYRAFSRR